MGGHRLSIITFPSSFCIRSSRIIPSSVCSTASAIRSATTSHKLSPRSTPCVFLGYPSSTRGIVAWTCLAAASSSRVVFDEFVLDFLMQGPSLTSAAPPSGIEWPCATSVAPSFSKVGQPNLQVLVPRCPAQVSSKLTSTHSLTMARGRRRG